MSGEETPKLYQCVQTLGREGGREGGKGRREGKEGGSEGRKTNEVSDSFFSERVGWTHIVIECPNQLEVAIGPLSKDYAVPLLCHEQTEGNTEVGIHQSLSQSL